MSSSHDHSHHSVADVSGRRLLWAILINVLLTIAQIIGGLLSGSLALIADALHNFSDAGALGIALIARKIALRPADTRRTFGYRRAETIGALINVTILILIGFYLIYEAIGRFLYPEEVEGWIVVYVAGFAFVIDFITAMLTYSISKENLNARAAFIHNVSDALGSIIAMISGALIILYGWYVLDTIASLIIAGYVLYQSFYMMKSAILVLMESVPTGIEIEQLITKLEQFDHVEEIHHVHVWDLDEQHRALEAHVVIDERNLELMEEMKRKIKTFLQDEFSIGHSTLEFEIQNGGNQCPRPAARCF